MEYGSAQGRMARYKEEKLPYAVQDRLMGMFCETLCKLKTKKAVQDFLKDLLNRQERAMLIRRLLIAEMLLDGYTYGEIINQLHCGTTTIARVERWLNFGRGGFKRAVTAKKK